MAHSYEISFEHIALILFVLYSTLSFGIFVQWKKNVHKKDESVQISGLFVYPIKSCAGIEVESANIVETGFEFDREWMLIGTDGKFLGQRKFPKMALLHPRFNWQDKTLEVVQKGDDNNILTLPLSRDANTNETIECEIYGEQLSGFDGGDETSKWFSEFLGVECRLVRRNPEFPRILREDRRKWGDDDEISFTNTTPFLLISEASLQDLNGKLNHPVSMKRFRPNIIVSGCKAFDEDNFHEFEVNNVKFRISRQCSRCDHTTVDPETGIKKGYEPLKTLRSYRRKNGYAMFGVNLTHFKDFDNIARKNDKNIFGNLLLGNELEFKTAEKENGCVDKCPYEN